MFTQRTRPLVEHAVVLFGRFLHWTLAWDMPRSTPFERTQAQKHRYGRMVLVQLLYMVPLMLFVETTWFQRVNGIAYIFVLPILFVKEPNIKVRHLHVSQEDGHNATSGDDDVYTLTDHTGQASAPVEPMLQGDV